MQFTLLTTTLLSLLTITSAVPARSSFHGNPKGSATSVGGDQIMCNIAGRTTDAKYTTSLRLGSAALPDMVNAFRTVQLDAGKTWGVALGLPDMKLADGSIGTMILQIHNKDKDAKKVNGQRFVEDYDIYTMLKEMMGRCSNGGGTTMGGSVYTRPRKEVNGEGMRVWMQLFPAEEGKEPVNDL